LVKIVVERQINLRLEESIIEKVDFLVKIGLFKSRTEAFKEALRMLIDKYYRGLMEKRLKKIREGTENYPSLTEIVIRIHEDEEI